MIKNLIDALWDRTERMTYDELKSKTILRTAYPGRGSKTVVVPTELLRRMNRLIGHIEPTTVSLETIEVCLASVNNYGTDKDAN